MSGTEVRCPACRDAMSFMARGQRRDFGQVVGARVREGLFCSSCATHTVLVDQDDEPRLYMLHEGSFVEVATLRF